MKVMFVNRMMLSVICIGVLSLASGRLTAQEAVSATSAPASDAAVPAENDLPLYPVLTLGVLGGEDYFEGRADTLLPVWSMFDGNGLVLGNIRAAFGDAGAQELNIGLLYRHYVSDWNAILGANVYYDSRWTEHDSQFNQLGLGLECLTTWVDARVNVYIPENDKEFISEEVERVLESATETTRYEAYAVNNQIRELQTTTRINNYRISTIDVYEVPLKGVDAEIGVKLPLGLDNVEARLFGGYYEFEPKWDGNVAGDNEISGIKGRFEVRAWNSLFFNAELYENDDLYGSDYLMSASIRLPLGWDALKETFGGNLNASRNGRTGALTVSERMLEMVVRDPQVQVRNEVDMFESLASELETIIRNIVLLDRVLFVYGGNLNDPEEDGSAAHPFDLIQEGVNASAVSDMDIVYVFGAMTPYQESVLIANNSITLIGEGLRVGTRSSPTRGFGRPIIESQLLNTITASRVAVSPAILWARDAEQVTIGGFAFTGPESLPTLARIGPRAPLMGILAEDIGALTIINNEFDNLAAGVVAMNPTVGGFNHRIVDNSFNNHAVGIASVLTMDGNVTIAGNVIDDSLLGIAAIGMNMGIGPSVDIVGGGRATVDIVGNVIRGDAVDLDGLPLFDLLGGLLPLKVATVSEPLPIPTLGGVLALALPGADMDVRVRNNVITHPAIGVAGLAFSPYSRPRIGDAGLEFSLPFVPSTILDLEVSGNTLTGGGILDVVGLLGLPISEELGFDLGVLGIGAISVGYGAVMDNTIIANNTVSDYLIGIGAASLFGGSQNDAVISGNVLEDNVVGILGLAALGAGPLNDGVIKGNVLELKVPVSESGLQRISIANNTVRGGSLDLLNPLLSDLGLTTLFGTEPLQLPDINLAGITLVGLGGANLNEFSITGNTVEDNLLVIGVAAIFGTTASGGVINDNILENNILGIAAVAFDSWMGDLEIGCNRISGRGTLTALDSVLGLDLGPAGEYDPGLIGITLLGIDSQVRRFDIHDNIIAKQAVGIGFVGLGESNLKFGRVADNVVSDSLVGIFGASIGSSSRMVELDISGNTVSGLDDGGCIGIGLFGSDDAKLTEFAIQNNTVSQYSLGIGAFDDGAKRFSGDISLNTVSDYDDAIEAPASGVTVVSNTF